MSWVHEGLADHEGYAVGLIDAHEITGPMPIEALRAFVAGGPLHPTHTARSVRGALLRELRYPTDDIPCGGILYAQSACDCGWRSGRFEVNPATWYPYVFQLTAEDESHARELWHEHAFLEILRILGAELGGEGS
jgi:hypothetical protein